MDMGLEVFDEGYKGFRIIGGALPRTGDFFLFQLIAQKENLPTFEVHVRLSLTRWAMLRSGDLNPESELRIAGIQYTHGLIDLHEFERGRTYFYEFRVDTPSDNLTKDEIRSKLLAAYYNAYQFDTSNLKFTHIDFDGICRVLDISKEQCMSNALTLKDLGFLNQGPSAAHLIEKGGGYLTARGIATVEAQQHAPLTPDKLFAKTRSSVDSILAEIAPQVAADLNQIYNDLASGRSNLQWLQVAVSCRNVLQGFTEAILSPNDIPPDGERPAHDKTKNKLRIALKAKAERIGVNDKLREFVDEQIVFLLAYFDKFNDLLQRSVHVEQIRQEDAERCVIYTYLVIAEVLAILAIDKKSPDSTR